MTTGTYQRTVKDETNPYIPVPTCYTDELVMGTPTTRNACYSFTDVPEITDITINKDNGALEIRFSGQQVDIKNLGTKIGCEFFAYPADGNYIGFVSTPPGESNAAGKKAVVQYIKGQLTPDQQAAFFEDVRRDFGVNLELDKQTDASASASAAVSLTS